MDGIDAARAMLEERPLPVVIITAYSHYDVVARAVEAGVFGYLVKPFREADLLPAIQTARARHAELAAVRAESDSLRAALAARKLIERAKGVLMDREGLTEAEAFNAHALGRPAHRPDAGGHRRGGGGHLHPRLTPGRRHRSARDQPAAATGDWPRWLYGAGQDRVRCVITLAFVSRPIRTWYVPAGSPPM